MNTTTAIDQRTLEAAYGAYRLTLRKSSGNRAEGRSGSRKQSALKIVSERYHIPVGELKRAIRSMDEERGIGHEHTAAYQQRLDYQLAAAELEKQNTGKCPLCDDRRDSWTLRTEDDPDEVRVRVDPFEVEIYGELKPLLSCLGCYFAIDSEI